MGEVRQMVDSVADRARREADAYRGDEARPLSGYLAFLGVYYAVVTSAAVGAAAGRRLPERWQVQDLITVTRLVAGSFTAMAGADFLQLAYAKAQQAAEG